MVSTLSMVSRHLYCSYEEIKLYSQPIVYKFLRGDTCLYVGMSAEGIGRPFRPTHKMAKLIQPGDRLEITVVDTVNEAWNIEEFLINTCKPEYNDLDWYRRNKGSLKSRHRDGNWKQTSSKARLKKLADFAKKRKK